MRININFEPQGKRKTYSQPVTILKAAQNAGIRLKSVCGGKGECGKCRVTVKSDALSPLTDVEQKVLSADEIKDGYRLACKAVLRGKATVFLPPSSLVEKQRLMLSGIERSVKVFPRVRKYHLPLPPPTLQDNSSDFERIKDGLFEQYSTNIKTIDLEVAKTLSTAVREADWDITCSVDDEELIGIDHGDTSGSTLGIAIDVGTTKIALYLVDLVTGKTVDAAGTMNPQMIYGDDVLSRIEYAIADDSNLQRLRTILINEMNTTISELCVKNRVLEHDILSLSLVGNTAMHHILLGLPTRQLALAPYVATTNDALSVKSREIGLLSTCLGSYVHFPPPIASFVGSDHVAMLMASGISESPGNLIGIDIGTNTEISLKFGDAITCCSCASGPAFEGAHIKQGMRAAPGAIEGVYIDSRTMTPQVATVDDKKPIGICGSGVLDGIAEMLRVGIINSKGRIMKDMPGVRTGGQNELEFVLVPWRDTDIDEDIVITQKDVSEIQLAKAAIRTGIDVLLDNADINVRDVDQVILAGAFGSYIDPVNALKIGMFPGIPAGRFVQVGNAAGLGAKQILISRTLQRRAIKVAKVVEYIELAARPDFSERFAQALVF